VIQGIYPVVVVNSVVIDDSTVHDVVYNPIGLPDTVGEIVSFVGDFTTPQLFFAKDSLNIGPYSIGTALAALATQYIESRFETSIFNGGPLATEMAIGAVGFAIYYTSNIFPFIDPQIPQPFPTFLPNQGIAWALPLTADLIPDGRSRVDGSPAVLVETTTLSRAFYAYFFNHQWSYSTPTLYDVPPPPPPILTDPQTRAGLVVNVQSDVLTRADIIYQRWQADALGDFANPFLDITNNYQEGLFAFNAVATGGGGSSGSVGDVYIRSVRSDFFSSGNWSDTLFIPANPIGQDAVGVRAPHPSIVGHVGAIISYTATAGWLVVDVSAFDMTYPDGSIYEIPSASLSSSATVDTHASLLSGTEYLYYISVPNPSFASHPDDGQVDIDGPYYNPSTAALAFSTSRGRLALAEGALTFFTANALTGSVGGAGGGTFGG
jgi:hypothetical protein